MIKIIRTQPDQIIVDVSNYEPTWQEWHKLVIHLSQTAIKAQQTLKLILLFDIDYISTLMPETIDYLLNPEIFKEIYLSGASSEYDELIQSLIGVINSESNVVWHYAPSEVSL